MLKKGTINPAYSSPKQFLSPISLVPKKDSWQRVVLNLPYAHIKMEGLFLLKKLFQENKYMGKIDLKDPYFSVLVSPESQNWKIKFINLPVLCCGASTKIFAKLLKILISLLKKLNVCRKIFLRNILIMVSSTEEMALARNTLIFLLQDLRFLINTKK